MILLSCLIIGGGDTPQLSEEVLGCCYENMVGGLSFIWDQAKDLNDGFFDTRRQYLAETFQSQKLA